MKIAYDISYLGDHYQYQFDRPECKTGVVRVIEEAMYEIYKRDDVDLVLTGLCGENLVVSTLQAFLYTENYNDLTDVHYSHSFVSHLVLSSFYKHIYTTYFSKKFQMLPRFSAKSVLIKIIFKLLSQVQKVDIYLPLSNKSFDVFHSPFWRLPSKSIVRGIPRVLTIYDIIPLVHPKFVTSGQIAYCQSIIDSISINDDWIVCISEYTKQEFCQFTGMSHDRVYVAPLAASSHFYHVNDPDCISIARQRYGIPNCDYFLSIAALQPRKNFVHIISCFFRLLSEQPNLDINLVLAGYEGWMYEEIFAAANASAEFRSKVIFIGYILDEDISAIYSGAKAFIYPSLYEGFGLPPLEAMQCGIPVITSNTTSLPEVVGDAGIMVDPKDSDALCQAMLRLLTDTTLCEQLSQKGLTRAKGFSWAKCAADTVEVYRKAVANQ